MTSHKLISILIAMLLTTSYVAAQLQIAGVYYDPIQAESGGEAIQLENNGNAPVDLSTVTLTTKQSTYPLPQLTLLPGQGYLIADTGWDTLRDNLTWPLADYEVSLSLANTDGFVQVDLQNQTLDFLEWNSSFKAKQGFMLTAAGATEPLFRNSQTSSTDVPTTIHIVNGAPQIGNITMTDDAPQPGIQLLSFSRAISITAAVHDPNGDVLNVSATLFGNTVQLQGTNGTYSGSMIIQPGAAGSYQLQIDATDGSIASTATLPVSVISSASVQVSGNLTISGAPGQQAHGTFTVQNVGNVDRTITVQHAVPGMQCDVNSFQLQAGDEQDVLCTATIPSTKAGTYTYITRLLVQ